MADYGEPFHRCDYDLVNRHEFLLNPPAIDRAVACVNALAGVDDPADFMAAMRELVAKTNKSYFREEWFVPELLLKEMRRVFGMNEDVKEFGQLREDLP